MSVNGIEAVDSGFTPLVPQVVSSSAADAVADAGFGDVLLGSIDKLEGQHDRADQLAVAAATGDLTNIHDYTIAATEATVATQMTVAIRNKAVEAFSEIMRMQV